MDISDKEVLFNLSEQLSSVLTPNPSKLLDDLQKILFAGIHLDFADVLNRVREVLCDECLCTKSSKPKKMGTMSQTEHKLLVLEVTAHLGVVFLSVASGKDPNSKAIKRLDQLLLPPLFLTTSVKSDLFCEIALKSPLQILHNAYRKDPQVRCILDRLEAVFLSWKTNYGCDFLPPRPTASQDGDQPLSVPLLREVTDPHAVTDTLQHVKRPVAACAIWDAGSYSRQPTHRRSLHPMRTLPAYLLSKRRQNFTDERYSEASSSQLGKTLDEPFLLNSKAEFSLPDMLSDSGDSDSLAAFETPVKRRKTDPLLFVPPSPDRTHKY